MELRECYAALELRQGAGMDEVKTAFRRLAFRYHPDLNGDDDAPAMFRRINEAYVTVTEHLSRTGAASGPGPGGTADTGSAGRREPPRGADQRQGAEAYRRQQRHTDGRRERAEESTRSKSQRFFYREEEVLKDLLNDPFARKVFEDIYRKIRKKRPGNTPAEVTSRKLRFRWKDHSVNLDLTRGLRHSVKSWLAKQLDHEQVVHFPATQLLPGRKIRITVEQKFSEGPRTVDVTLPPDFVVGRPIRLKGLGRKLGPLTGDLLLRILAR